MARLTKNLIIFRNTDFCYHVQYTVTTRLSQQIVLAPITARSTSSARRMYDRAWRISRISMPGILLISYTLNADFKNSQGCEVDFVREESILIPGPFSF